MLLFSSLLFVKWLFSWIKNDRLRENFLSLLQILLFHHLPCLVADKKSNCCCFIHFLLHFASKNWCLSWVFCGFCDVSRCGYPHLVCMLLGVALLQSEDSCLVSSLEFLIHCLWIMFLTPPVISVFFWQLLLYVCYALGKSPSPLRVPFFCSGQAFRYPSLRDRVLGLLLQVSGSLDISCCCLPGYI